MHVHIQRPTKYISIYIKEDTYLPRYDSKAEFCTNTMARWSSLSAIHLHGCLIDPCSFLKSNVHRRRALSWVSSHLHIFVILFNTTIHLRRGLPNDLTPWCFPTKLCLYSCFSSTCLLPCQSHPSRFNHPNKSRCKSQIMSHLFTQFFYILLLVT